MMMRRGSGRARLHTRRAVAEHQQSRESFGFARSPVGEALVELMGAEDAIVVVVVVVVEEEACTGVSSREGEVDREKIGKKKEYTSRWCFFFWRVKPVALPSEDARSRRWTSESAPLATCFITCCSPALESESLSVGLSTALNSWQ